MKRVLRGLLISVGTAAFVSACFGADPLLEGYRLFGRHRFDEAVGKFRLVLESQDADLRAEARYMLGRVLQMRGKWQDAMEEFARLEAEHPESEWVGDAMIQQGQCRVALGQGEEAVARFEAARARYPNTRVGVAATYHLGLVYLGVVRDQRPDRQRAQEAFERVIKEAPESEYALRSRVFVASIYRDKGEIQRALATYKQVAEMSPDSRWGELARAQLAFLYRALGRDGGTQLPEPPGPALSCQTRAPRRAALHRCPPRAHVHHRGLLADRGADAALAGGR